MNNLNIIDQFLQTFSRYIDSGFGLLNGDVVGMSSILIAIDVTLAGLFWALDPDADILVRLIKKVLYIGAFAYLLNNFQTLTGLVFSSFAKLGLDATGAGLGAQTLTQPGAIAGQGFTAAWPLIQQAGTLVGVTSFFTNFLTIAVLFTAWLLVLIAFFLLAIQVFVTVLEFKLTCLAGFTLVPFAFWNRSSFLAERVLGSVVSSGVKVMVLAVIVGIGSTLFSTFTVSTDSTPATIASAMSLVLAALTFLGLGIFGPAIATGLVAGAPQLGAGAVIGTAGAVVGTGLMAGGLAAAGLGALGSAAGGLSTIRAGSSLGGGSAPPKPAGSPPPSGGPPPPAGGAAATPGAAPGAPRGAKSSGGSSGGAPASASDSDMPAWARQLQTEQRARDVHRTATEAVRDGDRPGAPANPELDQEEE
jgi:type IV secretion system protein TrbL